MLNVYLWCSAYIYADIELQEELHNKKQKKKIAFVAPCNLNIHWL